MATPVGHYLFGFAIAALAARTPREREQAAWWATVACVPDLDVLPGLAVGNLSLFHHGASHSLGAAAAAAIAGAGLLAWARGRVPWRVPVLIFVLYTSHTVLDSLTLDTGPPVGVPWLWPWSEQTFQAPWLLLPNVQHTREPLVSMHNALLAVREALIFVPLAGLALAAGRRRSARHASAAWLCGLWFVAAAGVSIASLN